MRVSKKHVTHIGPEARTLSSKPLPPSPSLPPRPTQRHEVAQLGEAATPLVSGAGRAPQRGARPKGPSPGTLQGFILCPRLTGRSGRVWETRVTEEEGLKEEMRSEGRAGGDRK